MSDAKRAGGLRQIDSDIEPVSFAGKTADERARISLRHIEAIHGIKTRMLGRSYVRLGEVVWQLLCAVRLSELHTAPFDIAAFGRRFAMSDAILSRVTAYLEAEGLLCYTECEGEAGTRVLALTETAVRTIEDILEASAESFSGSFNYPKLAAVT